MVTMFGISFGVRQGSVLTTFLFHIYLDHLAKLNNCAKRLFIFIIIYADDILLIEPGCAYISTRDGRTLSWVSKLRYLGIFTVKSRNFKYSLSNAKGTFYSAVKSVKS